MLQTCRGFRFGTGPMVRRLTEPLAGVGTYPIEAPEGRPISDRSSFEVYPAESRRTLRVDLHHPSHGRNGLPWNRPTVP
jgi:hypothetical protein